jgi:peroxiredoxin Q/BCP
MLQVGQPAPGFDLPDADMELVSLAKFRNRRNVVVYFYPRDDTPGCTMESIDFTDLYDDFERHQTVVLGISMDDFLSHSEFRDKYGIAVQLLSDVEGEVCGLYGVLQEKERDGVRKNCIQRSTFVVDKRGMIVQLWYGVKPRGHAADVLQSIRSLAKCK